MTESSIYQDIAKRTGGDIYVGVVGPVRTGKSTFIGRFLDEVVLPHIEDDYDKTRTADGMPQSATGRTIMTTEPKFIPDSSVRVKIGAGTEFNVKLIDCVGYLVDGALGAQEGDTERMVNTPWSEEPIPFTQAAEIGTGKVIREHATIGILVTTDGSIGEIPRDAYVPAEERVAAELKACGKPFAIVLNSAHPEDEGARTLAEELEKKYGVPVALVNCLTLDATDIREILGLVLEEFPIRAMSFTLPEWVEALPPEHEIRQELFEKIRNYTDRTRKIGDVERRLPEAEGIVLNVVRASDGTAELHLPVAKEVFYRTLSEMSGVHMEGEGDLFRTVQELAAIRQEYAKVEGALRDVNEKGYGIVMPSPDELKFEEPKLVKQSGGWGVKVSARAESIHMIKAGIRAELSPVVGTEEQSEEVVKYLTDEFDEDPRRVWQSNMFGKSLYDLMSDGLNAKLAHIPDDSREKLGQTLEKIINEGSNGLICILL